MIATTGKSIPRQRPAPIRRHGLLRGNDREERRRAQGYPISRWYVRPAAGYLAAVLAPTRVRPVHLTACGLACGAAAGLVLGWQPHLATVAAGLVLAAWFFDRADGQLARRQGTVSARGAWLDANVDELLDVGWHLAVAMAASWQTASSWPWGLVLAFVCGKYLFMHGLATEEHVVRAAGERGGGSLPDRRSPALRRLLRAAWHLPGNADVRVHLLAAALLTGCLNTELAIVAVYYNLRWMVRYGLVVRRLGG